MTSLLVSGQFAAHVFVDDLDHPAPAPDDAHHLFRVRRLRPGERVSVGDGAGRWRPCVVVDAVGAGGVGAGGVGAGGVGAGARAGAGAGSGSGSGAALQPDGGIVCEPTPEPEITVGFALTKGDRPEWTVQKLTEAGVDRILPLVAERSVVRWSDADAARHRDRWERVAREAAMQSRRARLPVVLPVTGFADAVAGLGGRASLATVAGGPPALDRPVVLVGPEGGWSAAELASGLAQVALGGQVLRAETAAVAAGVLFCALREQVVAAVVQKT